MFFLSAASNFKKGEALRHTFSFGLPSDSKSLKNALKSRYSTTSDHVALTSSGRAALAIALKSSVPKNSKIVLNAFTCHAVLEAIRAANCVPIFADIEEKTLNFSPETLENLLKTYPDIKAFILQNSLGNPVDVRPFEKLKTEHGLIMIEDLAHCAGRFYPDGREIGTVGDAVALSFGKGKAIDTITGGAVILRNPLLPTLKAPILRQPLPTTLRARWYPFFGVLIRASYKIHCEKLVLGILLKLHFIERSADLKLDLKTRPAHWQAKLALKQLKNLKSTPLRDFVLVKNRDAILEKLKENGYLFSEFWYEVPVSPARHYEKLHFPENECPNAVKVSKEILNLPTWYKKSDLKLAKKIIEEEKQ